MRCDARPGVAPPPPAAPARPPARAGPSAAAAPRAAPDVQECTGQSLGGSVDAQAQGTFAVMVGDALLAEPDARPGSGSPGPHVSERVARGLCMARIRHVVGWAPPVLWACCERLLALAGPPICWAHKN